MKLLGFTSIALALLLVGGCASTNKSTAPTPENPIENPDKDFPIEGNPAPTNPIEDDGSAKITIEDNVIYVDGIKSAQGACIRTGWRNDRYGKQAGRWHIYVSPIPGRWS
jgi:hypothetical protein